MPTNVSNRQFTYIEIFTHTGEIYAVTDEISISYIEQDMLLKAAYLLKLLIYKN